ncbi:WD40-repeat-containing domain protein, partial [Blyttiomyces helicus]
MVSWCGLCIPRRARTVPIDDDQDQLGAAPNAAAALDAAAASSQSARTGCRALISVENGENPMDIEAEIPLLFDVDRWVGEFKKKNRNSIENEFSHLLWNIWSLLVYLVFEARSAEGLLILEGEVLGWAGVGSGYSTREQRSNLHFLFSPVPSPAFPNPPPLHIVYPAGKTIVVTALGNTSSRVASSSAGSLGAGAMSGSEQAFYTQHEREITAMCVHPEGGTVASVDAGPKPVVNVWTVVADPGNPSALVGKPLGIARFVMHGVAHVPDMAFTRDGAYLLVAANGDTNGEVFVFDWRRQELPVANAPTHNDKLLGIYASPWARKEFITCGVNHLSFWTMDISRISGNSVSLSAKEAVASLCGHPNDSRTKLSPEASSFPSLSTLNSPRLPPTPTFVCATYLKTKVVVTGTIAGDVHFWKGTTASVISKSMHKGPVLSLSPLNEPSLSFLSGGRDSRIIVWNDLLQPISEISMEAGRAVRSIDGGGCGGAWWWGEVLRSKANRSSIAILRNPRIGHASSENSIASNTGVALLGRGVARERNPAAKISALVGCGDSTVWEVLNHSTDKYAQLWGLATHPRDPSKLVTAGDDGWIRIWNIKEPAIIYVRQDQILLLELGWGECGGRHGGRQSIFVTIKHRRDAIYDVKYSPDGRFLAAASHDGLVDIYAVESDNGWYQRIMCCKGHASFVAHIDWSVDSIRLQTNSGNNEVMFWSINVGAPQKAPAPVNFREVRWASTTCVLGWATRGVYGSGSKSEGLDLGLRE